MKAEIPATLFIFVTLSWAMPAHSEESSMRETIFAKCREEHRSHATRGSGALAKFKKLEEELDSLFQEILVEDNQAEKEAQGLTVAFEGLAKRLEDSQRSSKEYVENQCAYEMQGYGTATMAADAEIGCRIDLTVERLNRLRKRSGMPSK